MTVPMYRYLPHLPSTACVQPPLFLNPIFRLLFIILVIFCFFFFKMYVLFKKESCVII